MEILRALIRHRTTVAAAEDLALSEPAVSNALKTMEAQAGFALFQSSIPSRRARAAAMS